MAAQPRALLNANPAYILQEMPESDWCCGCGGSFTLQHYEASAAIGRRKRDNIAASQCRVVATGCPACMLQITDMLSQAGLRVQVKHTVEVYAESLKIEFDTSAKVLCRTAALGCPYFDLAAGEGV